VERLDTIQRPENSAIESSVHLARYAIALSHGRSGRVLDVACGEGYGSKLLKEAGASRVDGIDISEEAILRARSTFGEEGISFHCADVMEIDKLFEPKTFELIVSLETIEHLTDPAKFLKAIKHVARDDALIIISCPNDHWYYPSDATSNPYHIRKYSFEEFRDITTQVLGENVQWMLGSAVLGFGNILYDKYDKDRLHKLSGESWLAYDDRVSSLMVPGLGEPGVGTKNCSYFVGIWGLDQEACKASTAVFPMSMDHYMLCVNTLRNEGVETSSAVIEECERLNVELASMKAELISAKEQVAQLERDRHKYSLQATALVAENDIMRASIQRLTASLEEIRHDHSNLERTHHTLKNEHDILKNEHDTLKSTYDELVAERNKALSDLSEVTHRYQRLARMVNKVVPSRILPFLRRIAHRLIS
jgi:SAM-dependent methyltransferase